MLRNNAKRRLFMSLVFYLFAVVGGASNTGNLLLDLTNFRDGDGSVYVFIYNYSNQYPMTPFKHYCFEKSIDQNGAMSVEIEDLPFGRYAIVILDDENANATLDRFLGIPTEGYGFSNAAKTRFLRLPEYDDLLLDFANHNQRCMIRLRYSL